MASSRRSILPVVVLIVSVYIAYQKIYVMEQLIEENVKGKRVLITGASKGIGEQLAYHYAKLGARIVVTARTENTLKRVVQKCKELGGGSDSDYQYVAADMENVDSPLDVVTSAVEKLNGLDVLLLNHIWPQKVTDWKHSQENLTTIEKLMRVNFLSYVHLTKYAISHLEKSNGQIVVVSSWAAYLSDAQMVAYSPTKAALTSFFTALRKEHEIKRSSVAITICHLGFISTDSAMENIKDSLYSRFINQGESVNETALAILKAGSRKQPDLIYPYLLGLFMTNFPQFFWNLVMKNIL